MLRRNGPDKFWSDQKVLGQYEHNADLHGTGNRRTVYYTILLYYLIVSLLLCRPIISVILELFLG